MTRQLPSLPGLHAFPYPRLWLQRLGTAENGAAWRVRAANMAAQTLWQLPELGQRGRALTAVHMPLLWAALQPILPQLSAGQAINTNLYWHDILGQPMQHSVVLTPLAYEATTWDLMALPVSEDILAWQRERDDALTLMTAAFEASPQGIVMTDNKGRVVRVNPAFTKAFGYAQRHVVGQIWANMLAADQRQAAQKWHDQQLPHRLATERASHEWRLLKPQGGTAAILMHTTRLQTAPNRVLLVHHVMDISEHKETEETLRWAKEQADGASRAKSTFLAHMSHELRTPLNAILGFSEVMKNQIFGPIGQPKYVDYLHDIHFAAQHLLEIINDVLDMSKIEAGKYELHEETVDVRELLAAVQRLLSERAAQAGLELQLAVPAHVPALWADKRVLRQMVLNVLGNAIKFTPNGKKITIGANMQPDGTLAIWVEDEGRGMTPAMLQRALEPFGQAESADVQDGRGTGLGLPLTRAMMQLHQGELQLQSTWQQGTRVGLQFPQARVVQAMAPRRRQVTKLVAGAAAE